MFNYSRTLSKQDALHLYDIIRVFSDDFCNDFDIEDHMEELKKIFSTVQFDYITKQDNKIAQSFHLMWVLEDMNDMDISKFLDIIRPDYDWIVHKIESEVISDSNDTLNYLEKLKSIQNAHRKHTLYNVHRTEQFLKLREALRSLNTYKGQNSVVLFGGLSSGKKWLALDVCSDFGVLKSMNFKIIWIDCSNCISPEEDYKSLKILMTHLNPNFLFDNGGYTCANFVRLKEKIKLELKSKENNQCLLVLSNVQNTKCVDAFNLECKRLIITRNRKVSNSLPTRLNNHIILNQGLTREEFYLLLDKYKDKDKGNDYDWRNNNLELANDIYDISFGEPRTLSIIAQHISKKESNWSNCMENINNFKISDKKLQLEIDKSLKILNEDELQLFVTFAIFPRCAQIPVKLLAYLWNLQLSTAEDIISKLDNYFFVHKRQLKDNETIVCYVNFMYSSYISNCPYIRPINQNELHTKIVKYYRVEEHLNSRKDVDLDVDSYDDYFYRWIGYHLYHSDDKHLLAKLYTDFGFLAQKIRILDINDTIADINNYKIEIVNANRKFSLKKFNNFLAKTEEKLTMFKDCCLLQYALFSNEDFIRELALKQIEKFPQRLWFTERGQYQQWRFIYQLPHFVELICILDDELCLVLLADHNVYLIDLKLGSNSYPIQLINNLDIKDIQVFDEQNYILTLDRYGIMTLWDISEEKRRIIKQRSNTINKLCSKTKMLYHKQIINNLTKFYIDIQTFYLKSNNYSLYVILKNGQLIMFDWNRNTKTFQNNQIPHSLDIKNIHNICVLNNTHCMIFYYTDNNNMNLDVRFLKLRNTELEKIKLELPENGKLLYRKVYDDMVLLVFQHIVLQVQLTNNTIIYETKDCTINCAKMLLDNKYLILGTERGVKLIDINKRCKILQSIVSENVNSIDCYDLDDNIYKSMIVCGCSNKTILYIFGLRLINGQTLIWEHSIAQNSTQELLTSEELCTQLIGNRLFALCDNKDTLYAIDSKYRIHQISCSDSKRRTILANLQENHHIVAVTCFENSLIVAYKNGAIYDYFDKCLLVDFKETLPNGVFLEIVDSNRLIMSWPVRPDGVTYIKHNIVNGAMIKLETQTFYCQNIMNNHLLLVNIFGAVLISDYESNLSTWRVVIEACELLASCVVKNNVLFLGFLDYGVNIYTLEKTKNGSIDLVKRPEIPKAISTRITCLTANEKADLLAIAVSTTDENVTRSTGDIEIFKINDDYKSQLIYILKSHIQPINDLKFSPQNEILVSVGECICFWNITYVLNNPLDVGNRKRYSSRFTSQKSTEEEVDFKINRQKQQQPQINECFLNIKQESLKTLEYQAKTSVTNPSNTSEQKYYDDYDTNNIEESNNWSGLMGPTKKPELLSCLKLDGSEAKQIITHKNFTQFSTIDNEGVYYNLERLKLDLNEDNNSEDNDITDSSSSSEVFDYKNASTSNQRLSIASSIISGTDVVDAANNNT